MKTITEFAAPTLKNAAKTKQDLLASGKTPEELPQAMGEALKLEGDKLNFLLNAVEMIENKQEDLKRVVVSSLTEGEKAPHGSVQKGEQCYSAEYYAPLHPPKGRGAQEDRGGKDRDRKKGKKGKGRRGRRGEGRGRPEGAPGEAVAAGQQVEGQGEGERKPRENRRPRGPRPDGKPLPLIQPKGQGTPAPENAQAQEPAPSQPQEQQAPTPAPEQKPEA